MDDTQNILTAPGYRWQQNILSALASHREFPGRLRIINLLRTLWGLQLLKRTTPSGLKLLLDVTDWVQSQIYLFGHYEPRSVALVKKLAGESQVILDVGSHIGQYALECANGLDGAHKDIFAIEVNPKTFTYLLNNIQINNFKGVKAVLGAVTAGPGLVDIAIPAYWNMGNTQIQAAGTADVAIDYLSATVNITDLLNRYTLSKIDLIKIDIEGHEANVIADLFKKNIFPTNVVFEYIPDAFPSARTVVDLFMANGYAIKDMDGKNFRGQTSVPEQNLWAQKI